MLYHSDFGQRAPNQSYSSTTLHVGHTLIQRYSDTIMDIVHLFKVTAAQLWTLCTHPKFLCHDFRRRACTFLSVPQRASACLSMPQRASMCLGVAQHAETWSTVRSHPTGTCIFLSLSNGKMPVQTRIRWYRKGDVACVPPAESVCGVSVGSHVPLALVKWPQINHMPPRAVGGSPQSAGLKVAHDRTTGLGCTHLVTNRDQPRFHESTCEIRR